MKAGDLVKILSAHPDWTVGFQDYNFGGLERELEDSDIRTVEDDPLLNPDKHFLFAAPYCGPDPE